MKTVMTEKLCQHAKLKFCSHHHRNKDPPPQSNIGKYLGPIIHKNELAFQAAAWAGPFFNPDPDFKDPLN